MKDPVLRPTSEELMGHSWMETAEEEREETREVFKEILNKFRESKKEDTENILVAIK